MTVERSARVGIVVDHPKRDLPGALMLAHELAKRGAESFLVPQYEQAVDVPLLGLDMLVVNYARPVNLELVRGFAAQGISVYVLDTEGGVLAEDGPNTPAKLAAYIRSSGYAELLSGYFFWGRLLRDAFASDGAIAADRLHLTGCPRFDFAAPSRAQLREGKRSGHVLVNTNYPGVNPRFVHKGGDDRAALSSAGYADDYVEKMLRDTRAIMAGMIETVRNLAAEQSGQSFVLRPHPFENEEVYRTAFAGLPNVEVDGSGDVIEALSGARYLLHLNCGTSIEAIMLGVVPLSLEFLNTEHMACHASLPSRASRPVGSFGELGAILARPPEEAGFDFRERHARLVEPYFHLNDGQAGSRAADVIVDDWRQLPPRRPRRSIGASLRASRKRPRPGQVAQSVAANMFGSAASSRLRALAQKARLEKALDRRGSAALLERLAAFDGVAPAGLTRPGHPLTGLPLASLRVGASTRGVARS